MANKAREDFLRALEIYRTMVAYDVGDDPFDYTQDTMDIHSKWTQKEALDRVISIFDSVAKGE